MYNCREHGKVTDPFATYTSRPSMIEEADVKYISVGREAKEQSGRLSSIIWREQRKAVLDQMTCHVTPEKENFSVHGIMQTTVSRIILISITNLPKNISSTPQMTQPRCNKWVGGCMASPHIDTPRHK